MMHTVIPDKTGGMSDKEPSANEKKKKHITWLLSYPRGRRVWLRSLTSKHNSCTSVVINVKRKPKGNQEWTIQRNCQHWVQKTKTNKTKNNNKNTTQYVLNAAVHQLTQIT